MLTYFPTPYPDEWWYSVLCRYHIRSGRRDAAVTLQELYGTRPLLHAKLFPGIDQYAVLKQIPGSVFSQEVLLLKHTLLPYYLRFTSFEKKQKILGKLLKGQYTGIRNLRTETPEGKRRLKFCPLCYTEDESVYGEPYWHREHQIPLIELCPKHKRLLCSVEILPDELEKRFFPLSEIPNEEGFSSPVSYPTWWFSLSDTLFSILAMPFEFGPPQECSSFVKAFKLNDFSDDFDMEKLRQHCFEFYGKTIGEQYFASMKDSRWSFSLPERYALLSVMIGVTVEEILTSCDHLMSSSEKDYVSPPLLNKRTEVIRMNLTTEEMRCIAAAADKRGARRIGAFSRKILVQGADRILQELSHYQIL